MHRALVVLLVLAAWFAAPAQAAPRFHFEGVDRSVVTTQEAEKDLSEMTPEERREIQERLKLRRKLVDVHQVFAFVAASSITAANVFGMVNHIALEHGAPKRSELEPSLALHRVLVGAALGSYLGAGITAWTMPPAYKRAQKAAGKGKVDSGDVHVALSVAHGIGMGLLMVTGALQANAVTGEAWDALLTTHTVAGFATAGLVFAAAIAIGSF